ncbi:MAG: beta-ketoacyl synthase chain length factor [Flavipsychrobacter sp.]|nr:beta-ketoacyl synthase chain length factor [Flavipsychrobacter sp.]
MNIYIKGAGVISAAGNNSDPSFLAEAPGYDTHRLNAKEPDYTAYIQPMQLRRMSKAVRMGIGASKIAGQQAGIEKPDALSIGTAMGCLQDTEVFLSKMIDQQEQMLTPTAFIQSTHNTVGGQIALLAGCYGHNLTYVHRGHSFEHAIINAQLYLHAHPHHQMLVGGIDELVDSSVKVLTATGVYREGNSTEGILHTAGKGSIAGEGAGFFIASAQPAPGALRIKGLQIFTTKDAALVSEKMNGFLAQQQLQQDDIDLLISGWNGDSRTKPVYDVLHQQFSASVIAGFKHLSGEYATASSFGLAMAAHIAGTGMVPGFCRLGSAPARPIRNIILFNNYMHYFSMWHICT